MIVRFWGTRGSLPVAQKADVVRDKVISALMASNGLAFETDDEAASWLDENLDFSIAGTYGGATSCVCS